MGKTVSLAGKSRRIFYGYWILTASFICLMFLSGFHTYSFGLFVKELEGAFGWKRQAISLASTISTMMQAAGAVLVGRLVDRYGSKRIIIFGALTVTTGYILMSFMQKLWQFYLFYGFSGIGFAGVGFVTISAIIFNWFEKHRGIVIGIAGVGIGAGGFLMPLLVGSYLIPNFGWRLAFRLMGITISSLVVPLALLVLRDQPRDIGLEPYGAQDMTAPSAGGSLPQNPERGLTLGEALRTSTFWLITLTGMAFGFGSQSLLLHQSAHLQDIGFELAVVARGLSIAGIFNAGSKFFFGWLCDLIKPKYLRALGLVFQFTAVLLIMAIRPSSPLTAISTYAIFIGLAMGSWLPSMSLLISTSFGMTSYATIFSITGFFNMMGGATGPLFAGYIFDSRGSYQFAFRAISILSTLAIVATLFIKQPRSYPGGGH